MSQLPDESKPFAAAILKHVDWFPRSALAQFNPDKIELVHEAYANYLVTLSLTDAHPVAERYREEVESAGLMDAARGARNWLWTHRHELRHLATTPQPQDSPLH